MGKLTEITALWDVHHKEVARLTLCGSTKFRSEYELWNKRLTLAGFLVYSVSGFGHSGDVFTDEEKAQLDQIHLAKIDASHAIVVINPGGYVGESTKREIAFAEMLGKDVFYAHVGSPTVYQLRTGPDGPSSMRYRAFGWGDSPIKVESHRFSLTDAARDEVMAEIEAEDRALSPETPHAE
ncbi:hypothetical protein [Caulobacter segnis]